MSEHEQPDVVPADPQRLQALRRALEERAVLTYCTDGATFRHQRPISAGLPVGSYVTLEVPGGATYFGQVITQPVVLGDLVLMRMSSNADLAYPAEVFSQVPASLLGRAPHFTIGQALIAGRPVPSPTFVTSGRRLSREGGGDIPATWATGRDQRSGGD